MMTIVVLTWKEMLRKRVMTLSLILTALFLIAFWFVARAIGQIPGAESLDPENMALLIQKFMRGAAILSVGFFFGSFVIGFLSIFSAVGVVSGEAELGVLQALLPRPIRRTHWYLGRWTGFVSLGVLYAALLFFSIVFIAEYHAAAPTYGPVLLKSFALFAGTVPLLVSVTMLGSCFFSSLGNGVFMVMLFGAGWLGGMIEKVMSLGAFQGDRYQSLQTVSGLLSLLMPADALQRRMMAELLLFTDLLDIGQLNRELGPFAFQQFPSNSFLVYAFCYTMAALGIGLAVFRKKDL